MLVDSFSILTATKRRIEKVGDNTPIDFMSIFRIWAICGAHDSREDNMKVLTRYHKKNAISTHIFLIHY